MQAFSRRSVAVLTNASSSVRAGAHGARNGVAFYLCRFKHGGGANDTSKSGDSFEDVDPSFEDINPDLVTSTAKAGGSPPPARDSESSDDELRTLAFDVGLGLSKGRLSKSKSFDDGLLTTKGNRAALLASDESATFFAAPEAEVANFEGMRRSIISHLDRLRRIDAIALSAARKVEGSVEDSANGGVFDPTDVGASTLMDAKSLPEPGPPVDYCVFCYHGTFGLLRPDNSALLTRFVSERGSILPKRFTHCCAKHQRKLAATIRRAKNLNLIPFQAKLHPRLRFSTMIPAIPSALKARGWNVSGAGAGRLGSMPTGKMLSGVSRNTGQAAMQPSPVSILAGLNKGNLAGGASRPGTGGSS